MIFAFASILQLLLQWLLPRPITLKSKKPFSDTPVKILVLGNSHMKTVDALQLVHGLGGHVVHGVAPARRLSTSHGHPLRAYNSVPHWPNSVFPEASQQVIVLRSFLPQSFNSPPHLRFVFTCYLLVTSMIASLFSNPVMTCQICLIIFQYLYCTFLVKQVRKICYVSPSALLLITKNLN